MSPTTFRQMPERLSWALELLRRREVPPFDETQLARLRPHQQHRAQQMREEHAERVKRARQRTSDPAFEQLTRADWVWLEAAHLVDLFIVSEDGARTEFVQLTTDGRRTHGYVDRTADWAAVRARAAAGGAV